MNIHEYQAKQILRRYNVPLLAGHPATTPEEALAAAESIGGELWVVKSQIHAGGRGKGRFLGTISDAEMAKAAKGEDADGKGGVRLARSTDAVKAEAADMLGKVLVTKQTGTAGKQVHTLFVEQGCNIAQELYLSVMLDRSNNKILLMASEFGGMNIEDVAHDHPEAIKKVWVEPAAGLQPFQARQLAFGIGLTGKAMKSASKFFARVYEAFMATDCAMLEINPMVITGDDDAVCLDAKMSFDDNALYRHKDIEAMRDPNEEDEAEMAAAKWNLSYVNLDGNIGCMVNGAGLAMSTMDIIQFKGAEPANFLDVGGGAKAEQVAAAFRIITSDPSVKGILVNIFGGIMKCDVIAEGVIAAVKEVGLEVPLVVRLSGTNAELGKKILAESGLAISPAGDLDEAADLIVKAVGA